MTLYFWLTEPDSGDMSEREFYDILGNINRDFRQGRLSQAEHDAEVHALVDAYEKLAA